MLCTGMVVPSLTVEKGKVKLPLRRNVFVVLCLYTSHSFSAWVSLAVQQL